MLKPSFLKFKGRSLYINLNQHAHTTSIDPSLNETGIKSINFKPNRTEIQSGL